MPYPTRVGVRRSDGEESHAAEESDPSFLQTSRYKEGLHSALETPSMHDTPVYYRGARHFNRLPHHSSRSDTMLY